MRKYRILWTPSGAHSTGASIRRGVIPLLSLVLVLAACATNQAPTPTPSPGPAQEVSAPSPTSISQPPGQCPPQSTGPSQGTGNGGGVPDLHPPSILHVVSDSSMSDAESVMVQALQGLLAQQGAAENLWIAGQEGYDKWLNDLQENYGVQVTEEYRSDPWALVEAFKDRLSGYILYDLGQDSENVATSLSGVFNAVPVDTHLKVQAEQRGLQMVLDLRGRDERWALEQYWECLNHGLVLHQREDMHRWLRDYAAAARGLMFYDGNSPFLQELFSKVEEGSLVLGWGRDEFQGEDEFVSPASQTGLVTVPSDWNQNLSILSAFDPGSLEQNREDSDISPEDAHYVTFIMSDGDNLAWLLGSFATHQKWFGSPQRGTFPMGWTISPSMVDLAPTAMQWLYDQATPGDTFISGVSGSGYYYVSELPDLASETARLDGKMTRADLRLVYLSDTELHGFSPSRLAPYAAQPHIAGGFWGWYADYAGRHGQMLFVGGKPFVSVKYNLWEGMESPESLAAKLNAAPRDPKQPQGYSVVNVHPWSMGLDSVQAVIERLEPSVRVVGPETFIRLVTQNVDRTARGDPLVAASDASEEVKARADFVADGADDHQEVQAAIDALPPSGGQVTLSQGHFTGGSIEVRSGVTLQGRGFSTVYKLQAGTGSDIIYGSGGDDYGNLQDVVVRDLKLHGNRFAQSEAGNGIAFHKALNVTVQNVYIQDAGGSAILLDDTQRALVSNNYIQWSNNGITVKDAIYGQNLIEGNALYRIDGSAVQIIAETLVSVDNNVVGNVIREAGTGILTAGRDGLVAAGNNLNGNRLLFIEGAAFRLDPWGGGNSITGNYVNDARWGIQGAEGVGQNLIASNFFSFIGRSAILLRGGGNSISANKLDVIGTDADAAYDAISIGGHDNLVQGNTITQSAGGPSFRYGIAEIEGADRNSITGNLVSGATEGAVRVLGSETVVKQKGSEMPVVVGLYYPHWGRPGQWEEGHAYSPVLGEYSSQDPSVMAQHTEWAREAGIDAFLTSWNPRDEDGGNVFARDAISTWFAQEDVLPAGIAYEAQMALNPNPWQPYDFNDPYQGGPETIGDKFLSDMQRLIDYGWVQSRHYYKIDGRPVVMFWTFDLWRNWWDYIDQMKANFIAAGVEEPYLIGAIAPEPDPSIILDWEETSGRIQALGGLLMYVNDERVDPENYWPMVQERFVTWKNYSESFGIRFIPHVLPGYDDRPMRGYDRRIIPRDDGWTLRKHWTICKEAVFREAPMLVVTSWNEWNEGHQIEPTLEYGTLYLELNRDLKEAWAPILLSPAGYGRFTCST